MANSAESLWKQALLSLPPSDQGFVSYGNDKTQVLLSIMAAVEQKKKVCLDKRWKIKKGNKEIILRDVLDKITSRIRRFCDIGSVIVQYDPAHAALPWAGFLLLLQITIGDVEKFSALVEGLEKISSVLTRYSLLEDVYPAKSNSSPLCKELQSSLIRLYTAILRYLVKAKSYFSQSTGKRVIASALGSSDSSVRLMLDVIFKKTTAVDSCLVLIQSEAGHHVKSQTDRILGLLVPLEQPFLRTVAHVAELHDHLSKSTRMRILRWLSHARPKQHHQTEANAHLEGSGTWLFNHPEFANWREGSHASILWLHGLPGCGKTKLVYGVIKRLFEEMDSAPPTSHEFAPVAFFYCARNPAEPERSNPTEIARSILKQLAVNKNGLLKDIVIQEFQVRESQAEIDGEDVQQLNLREAQALILKILEKDPATIILDGLDECDEGRRFDLLSMFHCLIQQSASVIKLLIASRDDGDIAQQLESFPSVYIRADDSRADLNRFIDHSLDEAVASGKLLKGKISNALRKQVSSILKEGANGMFRWATLHIDNLCDSRRIKVASDILDEVGRLPKTLSELYDVNHGRILQYARPSRNICQRILKWLMCAKRLMNTEDLIAAVTFPSERNVLDQQSILDLCSNMVTIDDNGLFRFAHLSVREYLETLPTYAAAECHTFVLQRCVESYINTSGPPWTSQSDDTLDWQIRPYSTLYWPEHCHGAIGTHTTDCMQTVKAFIFGDGANRATYGEAFPEWSSEAWNSSQYSFGIQCDPITLERLASATASPANPVFVACAFDLAWILSSMSPVDLEDLGNLRNYQNETCIQVAIRWKSWAALQWLVTNCPVDSSTQTDALWTVLECGDEDLDVPSGILLGGLADGFAVAKGHELNSALHYAVKFGLVQVARLVLMSRQHFKPYTFLDCFYMIHESPAADELFTSFWETCNSLDSYQTFTLLLVLNHDVSRKGTRPIAAKARGIFCAIMDHCKASEDWRLKGLRDLSDNFARVFEYILVDEDGQIRFFGIPPKGDPEYWTETATLNLIGVRGGDIACKVVLDVLDLRRTSPENPFEAGDGLLHPDLCLEEPGSRRAAEVLLMMMGDWSRADASLERTLLANASMLLSRGIDANASRDEKGRTLLIKATRSSNHSLMRVLIEHGAKTQLPDKKNQSPLVHAIKSRNLDSVKLLVELGSDVNGTYVDRTGRTPFEVAANDCRCPFYRGAKENQILQYMRECGARRPGASFRENGLSVPFLMTIRPCIISCTRCIATCLAPGPYSQDLQSGLTRVIDTFLEHRIDVAADTDSVSNTTSEYEDVPDRNGSLHQGKRQGEHDKVEQKRREFDLCPQENLSTGGPTGTLLRQRARSTPRDRRPAERLRELLVPNMKLWEDGLTPLHLAIVFQDLEMLDIVLETSTDVNAVDDHGFSALHYAVLSGNQFFISKLLHKGSKLNEQSRTGHTPLHLAAGGDIWRGDVIIPTLLKSQESPTVVDIKDVNGNTALHLATSCSGPYSRDRRIIECLIAAGADTNAQNAEGITPLQLAASNGMHLDWIDLFPVEIEPEDIFLGDHDPESRVPILQLDEDEPGLFDVATAKNLTMQHDESDHYPVELFAEADIYGGYGTAKWTALPGPDHKNIRAVDAVYHEVSAFI